MSNVYSQHNVYSHNIILLPQHNVYSHNIFLLIQGKVRSYEQFHVYYSNYMNDESNDESIKRLQSNVNANIFFEFIMLQYGCEINEDLDLNVKEYELYKNSLKLGNNDDKEEDVEFNCEDDMRNFLPCYYKATTNFTDKKDAFDLALCHYVSFENVNGPTFDQFEHYQKIIKKNKVINNNNQSSTDAETIEDLSIINK